ncbi:hypothetical protein PYW08_016360 [Mythimna loreyi]|uniref:Uncharacterized protein n=1 Tax=Mythimna loreyi TaxID=667449 RepID=A0ACC2QWU7_9NEOP|nr:hypothetical protein PYW08_016360 [Mythimna loreyi]
MKSLPDKKPETEDADTVTDTIVLPIYIYTAIFGVIFLIGPLLVRRGPNSGIARCCIMLSAFCCWIFWTTTYIVQLNPLLGPRLGNETLAWIGHKWGRNPKNVFDEETRNITGKKSTTTKQPRRAFGLQSNLSSNLLALVDD